MSDATPLPSLSSWAWWSDSVEDFGKRSDDSILGRLSIRAIQANVTNFDDQRTAWQYSIRYLREMLAQLPRHWRILLEYPLIRLGRRLDAVLITDHAIFVIEFKHRAFDKSSREQTVDYACDLRDFHAGSRDRVIVPILVADSGTPARPQWDFFFNHVSVLYETKPDDLAELTRTLLNKIPDGKVDVQAWEAAPYRPVPTIIEAARSLYLRHGVSEIKTARADTDNLSKTTNAILRAIHEAQESQTHVILFVTGIPGAGKTLCGLNAIFSSNVAGCFLTGTLPMVYVLKAALIDDAKKASKKSKSGLERETKSQIQSITGFVKEYTKNDHTPHEHVIVFDEAQRAWDAKHGKNSSFKLNDSEASIVLDIMARHKDFAVIVGLIGNGQEINTGEAGLAEWGRSLAERPQWLIRAAPQVLNTKLEPKQRLFKIQPPGMALDSCLHLDVALRNHRSALAPTWVDAVLRGKTDEAKDLVGEHFPYYVTRSLQEMRQALRMMTQGERRCGLVCSSEAKRLVADGIWPNFEHMKAAKVANWFLKRWPDVRASDALEVPATEYACQGLELDYVGLCWGGDLIRNGKWIVRRFRGNDWEIRRSREAQDFQKNTYRVLLTRARAETVIWVPQGDADDKTRKPSEFDKTADYLIQCGARLLPDFKPSLPDNKEPTLF